jgi:hypothetical protein
MLLLYHPQEGLVAIVASGSNCSTYIWKLVSTLAALPRWEPETIAWEPETVNRKCLQVTKSLEANWAVLSFRNA